MSPGSAKDRSRRIRPLRSLGKKNVDFWAHESPSQALLRLLCFLLWHSDAEDFDVGSFIGCRFIVIDCI